MKKLLNYFLVSLMLFSCCAFSNKLPAGKYRGEIVDLANFRTFLVTNISNITNKKPVEVSGDALVQLFGVPYSNGIEGMKQWKELSTKLLEKFIETNRAIEFHILGNDENGYNISIVFPLTNTFIGSKDVSSYLIQEIKGLCLNEDKKFICSGLLSETFNNQDTREYARARLEAMHNIHI